MYGVSKKTCREVADFRFRLKIPDLKKKTFSKEGFSFIMTKIYSKFLFGLVTKVF